MILRYDEPYGITKGMGQRAIADIIENDLVEQIVNQGGKRPKSVRTIEDVSLNGILIDIKTRDVNRDFSMPNLISIDRLRRHKDRTIKYVFVDYEVKDNVASVIDVHFRDIHTIPWECLAIQNLGLGQLQLIKQPTDEVFNGTKEEWFETLRWKSIAFYKKQIEKFERRITTLL